jgi:hypothetical protein
MKLWKEFIDKKNTHEILLKKAKALAHLVAHSSNGVDPLVSALNAPVKDDLCFVIARTRTAALLIRMIYDIALSELPESDMDKFIAFLFEEVSENLVGYMEGEDPLATLLRSYAEYDAYEEWRPEPGHSVKNTLLWEAAKRISDSFGADKNGAFNVVFANLMLRDVERWQLRVLLSGRQE